MRSYRDSDEQYNYNNSGEYRRRRSSGKGITVILLFAVLIFAAVVLFKGINIFAPSSHRQQDQPRAEGSGLIQPAVGESAGVESDNRYFRRQLSAEYQLVYDEILHGLQNYQQTIEFKIDNKDEISEIYSYVFWDHPELFWGNNGYEYTYSVLKFINSVSLNPKYDLSADEVRQRAAFAEEKAANAAAQYVGLSDYEKVKGVYDYIINNTVYDSNYSGKSVYEVFSEGKGVCEGYARTAQYLLQCLGIEAVYTVGYATNADGVTQSHAWLKVPIEGEYYNVDVTWGDPVNADGAQISNYAYLCVTDDDISYSHVAETNPYPPCTATRYNYYVMENRLLSTYDEQLLLLWFEEDFAAGKKLEFRAINDDVYQQTLAQLFDGHRYFNITSQIRGFSTNSCSYSQDDMMRVISISY